MAEMKVMAVGQRTGRSAARGAWVFALVLAFFLVGMATLVRADFSPLWISRVPAGTSLGAGPAGIHVDPDGVSYVTGITGSSSVNDIQTVSFAPDGSTRWSQTYDSGKSGDPARGIARGPGNLLYVVGNTPGPNDFAQVLILIYDATNGALLNTIKYSSGPGRSEYGAGIVGDAAGNIYIIGGTTGDGPDVMTVKFNSAGVVQWRKTYDGTAFSPLDQDGPVKILLDLAGNVLSCITGYMGSGHPDYVVVKYAAANGAKLWEATFGVSGGDFPTDMEIDAAGDVYVSGIGIDFIDKYSTVKFRGSDGQLLWQFYDALGNDHFVTGLFLDGVGGVFITGASDPEGNLSNFNDDFFTVKRDAATGAQLWTHTYGDPCVGCYDVPSDVRVDPEGNVFVIGRTSSAPFSNDVLLLVLDTATGVEKNRGVMFNMGVEVPTPGALRFDADFNLYDGGRIYNANTGAIDMSVTKWASLIAGGGGGIPCEDLASFQVRCKTTGGGGHKLQAKLSLTNTSHSGEQVTISVDGVPNVVTISGNKAQLAINNSAAGEHTLELTDPAGCFPPFVTTCD
jgi:hypothetical protein